MGFKNVPYSSYTYKIRCNVRRSRGASVSQR